MTTFQLRTLSFLHLIGQSILKMSFVERGLECIMATRADHTASGFFRILNKVSVADAEFLDSSPLSDNRRRSSGPFWEVERFVDKRKRNGRVNCPA